MKAKFKISQLAAKPIDVELEHPTMGKTGIVVKLVGPHSTVFQAAKDVYEASEGKEADNIRLFSACVIGWNEEDFEMPWSVENVFNFFSNIENSWAAIFAAPLIKDHLNFFPKK